MASVCVNSCESSCDGFFTYTRSCKRICKTESGESLTNHWTQPCSSAVPATQLVDSAGAKVKMSEACKDSGGVVSGGSLDVETCKVAGTGYRMKRYWCKNNTRVEANTPCYPPGVDIAVNPNELPATITSNAPNL